MEESNLFAKSMLDFQDDKSEIAPSDDNELQQQYIEEKENKCNSRLLNFKVHVLKESRLEDIDHCDQDGLNTPKSAHQRIHVDLACPPAPKKPKSLPFAKRKASSRQLVYLDLSSEAEFMFPPALRADIGNKIKKARHES